MWASKKTTAAETNDFGQNYKERQSAIDRELMHLEGFKSNQTSN
jgi:hypothetical protein